MELLFGQTTGQPQGQANPLISLLPLVLIFVVFYLLMILPQQRRQKQHREMLNALKRGDRVVTSAGMHGTVANIKEQVVTLVVADGVKIDFERSHIASRTENGAEKGN